MLPKNVILTTENSVLYWKNTSFLISVEEAKSIYLTIRTLIKKQKITAMLVDNQGVQGAWRPDVNPIWSELMGYLATVLDKCATIALPLVVAQINRLSKKQGTIEKIQAFPDAESAIKFIGVSNLSVLKRGSP